MMQIAILSDLHVDYGTRPRPIEWVEADVAVIAGDTANSIDAALPVILEAAERYKDVVLVDGNHEHWRNSRKRITVDENLEQYAMQLPDNVHLLRRGHHSVMVQGVKFIGLNGWYTADYMGDPDHNRAYWKENWSDAIFSGFAPISQHYPWTRAEEDARIIQDELGQINDAMVPVVVVTHTVPHRDCVRQGPEWSFSNNYFVNSKMQNIIDDGLARFVTLWIFGHTHDRMSKIINGVNIIANPRGENKNWSVVTWPIVM
jgi:predicted phosphodiesterase